MNDSTNAQDAAVVSTAPSGVKLHGSHMGHNAAVMAVIELIDPNVCACVMGGPNQACKASRGKMSIGVPIRMPPKREPR